MFSLENKVAVITGAGSGIGESIASLFARQGARVELIDVNEEALRSGTERLAAQGAQAWYSRCDVSIADQVQLVFAAIYERQQRLDILVNSAGVSHIGSVETTASDDFERVYRVNVKGTYHCLREAVPKMKASGGGAIVNLGSIASLVGLKERFAYSMSKGAVLTMTLSVAADYIRDHIRCNCICPARVHTPFVDDFLKRHYPGQEREMFEKLSAAQPIGRMGRPEEIASLALFLCSDEAAFITGSAYPIDGGTCSLV
jgi:NAD(P)-dependent dehydrogenase (short-subunit alcohol dehydrogenase family)